MQLSATRLTCFALISALEEDLRFNIESLFGEEPIAEFLSDARINKANGRRDRDGVGPATTVPAAVSYLDFGDGYEILMGQKQSLPTALRDSLGAIAATVPRLIAIRNRVAHTRPMEIDDSAALIDATHELLRQKSDSWPNTESTKARLIADPSYVLGLTIHLPTDPDHGPQHNLPVPDFDETGFFGRQTELRRIKKALKGAYPVVSVLGDGGIGKTSIALKAAYELLEDSAAPFEAIVWVSAKATILTPHEIRRINGAIESSLDLFAEAASELGALDGADPIDEVLGYLETFKVLLILDNLETVLDDRLRSFLLDLPLGSKVLVTSRIGLGIENPVRLEPLSADESRRLIRALSRVRSVAALKALDDAAVEALAERMDGHRSTSDGLLPASKLAGGRKNLSATMRCYSTTACLTSTNIGRRGESRGALDAGPRRRPK